MNSIINRRRVMGGSGNVPYEEQYFTFEALEDGTFSVNFAMYYSLDNGSTWVSLASSTSTPTIQAGSKILWKAIATRVNATFTATGNFNAYGNTMSMLYGDDFSTKVSFTNTSVLQQLFSGNAKLVSAKNMVLPATTLTSNCYNSMFTNCVNLIDAPSLPATTLVQGCYSNMFNGCTSLTNAPELPAVTLAVSCYNSMFKGCSSLTKAPTTLQATTLYTSCYNSMFYGCSSLTKAPTIYATTSAESCCENMFYGCSSLTTTTITITLPTTTANRCYYRMFAGCKEITTAPELPATILTSNCYYQMFNGCSKLQYIKCLATDISATACTSNWLNNVSSSGTFVKNASMNSWGSGVSGIPNNWTVENATS